jgi:hypothetical protein
VANSQSQDLNLRGDRALHSSLQEWITQQSKCETTDQGNGKALPDLDDDTSRIRQSYFSPSVVPQKFTQSLLITLQAVLRQSLRLPRELTAGPQKRLTARDGSSLNRAAGANSLAHALLYSVRFQIPEKILAFFEYAAKTLAFFAPRLTRTESDFRASANTPR